MGTVEIVAIIRDVLIIASTSVVSLAVLAFAFGLSRVYPSVRRTTSNLEEASSLLTLGILGPLSSIASLLEFTSRISGLINRHQSKRSRDDKGEEQ